MYRAATGNEMARRRRRAVSLSALFACLGILAALLWLGSQARTYAASGHDDGQGAATPTQLTANGEGQQTGKNENAGTPTQAVQGTQTAPATQTPNPIEWASTTLQDFAGMQGWPPTVSVGPNRRASVERGTSGTDWVAATIRTLDSHSAADAGFEAEQEDAALAGYTVERDAFYNMPAYSAVLLDASGQPVERRFRWLTQSYILGVEAHGPGTARDDLSALSRQLLTVAIQDGLDVSAQAQATATQTAQAQTPQPTPACGASFVDVPANHWAYSYITELACRGVVSGYQGGTFRPQSPTTRAQLVKMVVLMQNLPLVNPATPSFSDVGPSHVFYQYVETARLHNIIQGYSNGTFRPDSSVSRAQVAKIVVLSHGWPLSVASTAALCDVKAAHWAYNYVQVAIAHGLFSGYGDGCFYPDDPATRAQLAKVLVMSTR